MRGDRFKINPGNGSSVEPRIDYLVNDALLCVKQSKERGVYLVKGIIALHLAQVRDLAGSEVTDQPHCFQVTNHIHGVTHYIRAGSKQEKDEWIARLREVVAIIREQNKSKQNK